MEIVYKIWGIGFYFFGCDDFVKLKLMKILVGYVSSVWFEELVEFLGRIDIDIIEDIFI